MNIQSLIHKINLFEELVIDSGFKRDIKDYIPAISEDQNRNLVFMKDLSFRLKTALININNNDLDSELNIVLKDSKPFTNLDSVQQLNDLDSDTEIEAATYFDGLNTILAQLDSSILDNETELNSVREVFNKYIPDTDTEAFDAEEALVSLVFKDLKSIGSLNEFSKVLHRWNRTLLIYHTLLKSESPNDISLRTYPHH